MKKNTIALFGNLNQGDQSTQIWSCSIFAPANGIKYNSGLELTEKDLDKIIDNQIKKGLLSTTQGAKAEDSIKAIKDYIKIKFNKDLKRESFKSSNLEKLNEFLDLGYMVTIGIKVDSDFTKDVADGKINEKNYFNFNNGKTIGHFTNLFKWKGRFVKDCEKLPDYNKTSIYDSYAFNSLGRAWVYHDVDLTQLKNISQQYYYVFYIQ